jgi:hypothetical protein
MLIYDKTGKLIKINKLDFDNDKMYYKQLMNSKNIRSYCKKENNIYTVADRLVQLI